jgi:hypothetical protein
VCWRQSFWRATPCPCPTAVHWLTRLLQLQHSSRSATAEAALWQQVMALAAGLPAVCGASNPNLKLRTDWRGGFGKLLAVPFVSAPYSKLLSMMPATEFIWTWKNQHCTHVLVASLRAAFLVFSVDYAFCRQHSRSVQVYNTHDTALHCTSHIVLSCCGTLCYLLQSLASLGLLWPMVKRVCILQTRVKTNTGPCACDSLQTICW